MVLQVGVEGGVGLGLVVGTFDLQNERHQRFGDEAAAVITEASAFVVAGAQAVDAGSGDAGCDGQNGRSLRAALLEHDRVWSSERSRGDAATARVARGVAGRRVPQRLSSISST